VSESEPFVVIDRPEDTGGTPSYGSVVVFGWHDAGETPAVEIRHMWSLVVDTNGVYNPGFDIIGDLNENPWRYEDKWTRWISVEEGDSASTTIVGDDEVLELNRVYVFVVQARGPRGSVTSLFEKSTNARQFVVRPPSGPLMTISEPLLGGARFIGLNLNPERRDLPPGVPMEFKWWADARSYGSDIAGYRYGWDISDLGEWDAPFIADAKRSLEVEFYAGTHTLYVEAADLGGKITRGRFEITVVSFPMERNLLWVDDFYSTNFQQVNWAHPTETQHDDFWMDICSRASGFDSHRDVYDCAENIFAPPDLGTIGLYKNIIWTYSSSIDCWSDIVAFTPESQIGQGGNDQVNYLSVFLIVGGHLWTLGRSERGGGLAAVFPPDARIYPVNVRCEITGNRDDCSGDRSGVYSMTYRDYCVTMVDKIQATFRTDDGMPDRIVDDYDAMSYAYRDDADNVTSLYSGLPERLELWDEVTQPGRYFWPDTLSEGPGGFTYVECYDPAYWMIRTNEISQSCFHPMYRMMAVSDESVLNNCTVALWLTRYADIVPDVRSGLSVAAPSIHMGLPLWFFKRSQVDSIAGVVLREWGIAP
jgi:hypothetical protein